VHQNTKKLTLLGQKRNQKPKNKEITEIYNTALPKTFVNEQHESQKSEMGLFICINAFLYGISQQSEGRNNRPFILD